MGQRLRVLQLVSSLTIGGAEQIVLSLAERIDRSRFKTHVCSLSVVGQNPLQPEFERLQVPVLSLNARHFYDTGAVRKVLDYVSRHEIDLIHTHLTEADIIGRTVGGMLKIPVLSTMHNVPHNYALQRRDLYWLERITARYLTTHLVAVSTAIRQMYLSEWGIPPARIRTIHNAVRMEPFLAVPEGVPPQREFTGPVITNIARFNPQKAQHILLDAAQIVRQHFPQARFLLVGKGHLESELRQQAHALGIGENVIFTGVRRDTPHVLAQSDVFVLTSRWEGLPLSAIEAMAAARPVLLTAVGGNMELVEPGQSGLLIPAEDADLLALTLLSLLQDEPRRLALGRAARQRVQQHFSLEQFIHQYESLYEQLAGAGYPLGSNVAQAHPRELTG